MGIGSGSMNKTPRTHDQVKFHKANTKF
ncbi:hypothetical protein CCACVL1_23382 [Corchorus capsularis]|uniref:Uncharacterized protein n=1 Tax=Corchorus capsularis TaxID=210143 RepID=A0A1R3GU27_COCAP|nr:hypothetical protein CCACVL1_23382 [Corchorus capsularis]